jgi:hypothetical protein
MKPVKSRINSPHHSKLQLSQVLFLKRKTRFNPRLKGLEGKVTNSLDASFTLKMAELLSLTVAKKIYF